jgi:homoserine O-acetyltransferase
VKERRGGFEQRRNPGGFMKHLASALALLASAPVQVQAQAPATGSPIASPAPAPSGGTDYATLVREGDASLRNFAFQSGDKLPGLTIHYRTLGSPQRDRSGRITNAVMVLHGTGGTGAQFLQPQFAQELYGPGQPLDITRYYVILPDGIGHGGSSKPSDGLRMRFPKYDYVDMVEAQRRLLTEALGVSRLRLLMGPSMGCMHAFVWGERHPGMIDAMFPLACLPQPIAGHNRMFRKAAIDAIQADPAWRNGDYREQPASGLRAALTVINIMGFAPLYLQKAYPSRESAEAYIAERIRAGLAQSDANDLIYQLDASRNYDPSAQLERITVPLTWINSKDDLINPWNYGVAESYAARMPNARYVLIPDTDETRGHGTHTWAKFWKHELVDLLSRSAPR